MKYTLEEQETTILWDRGNPEAIVYTFEPSLKRKLKELEKIIPYKVRLIVADDGSVEYTIPKSLITVRKPREITEEARERLKENGSRLAKSKRPEAVNGQINLLQAL